MKLSNLLLEIGDNTFQMVGDLELTPEFLELVRLWASLLSQDDAARVEVITARLRQQNDRLLQAVDHARKGITTKE